MLDKANVWLYQAIETLEHYNMDSYIDPFLKLHQIDVSGARADKLKRIEDKINEGTLAFESLVDYLDNIKACGKQHVFLFVLGRNREEYLEKLRNPEHIKEKLRLAGLEDVWDNNQLIWESDDPRLAHVFLKTDGEKHSLALKWVYTRRYDVLEPEEQEEGKEIVLQTKMERAVSFLIIDLEDGSARINIQSLPTRSHRSLRQEFDAIKKEITRFIDFEFYSPVPLSPVIKRFLGKPVLTVTGWQIEYTGKQKVNGAGDPSLLFKMGLPFKHFFSREITMYWKVKQQSHGKPKLFLTMNGESDSINFNAITDCDKVDYILDQLKSYSIESIEMNELKQMAIEYPEYSRLISMIDFHFSGLKSVKLGIRQISAEVWVPDGIINKVFDLLVERFPRVFFVERSEEAALGVYNRFTMKGGASEYIKRGVEKSRRKEILKAFVNPTLILTFLFSAFKLEIGSWIREKIFQALIPGVDFIYIKIIFLVLLALFFFGTRTIIRKIPMIFISIFALFGIGSDEDFLSRRFSRKYVKSNNKLN